SFTPKPLAPLVMSSCFHPPDHVSEVRRIRPARVAMKPKATRFHVHPAWWTAVLIAIVLAFVWLCSAAFAGTLTSYVPVTLTSDRAARGREGGDRVKSARVHVGGVATAEGGTPPVPLRLHLSPEQKKPFPANEEAQIRATTIFGAKYVDLISPDKPSAQHI